MNAQFINEAIRQEVEGRITTTLATISVPVNIGQACERYLYLLIKALEEQKPTRLRSAKHF